MTRSGVAALALVVLAVLVGCGPGGADAGGARAAATPRYDFAGSGFAACPTATGPAPSGSRLPAVTLPCMDGRDAGMVLAAPTGRPLVLNLWASWCPPCGRELPAFEALHRDVSAAAGGPALRVVGVNTRDSATNAVAAARDLAVTFPNVYDRDGRVQRALGRNGLPVTVFVDARGRVRHVHTGPLDRATLRRLVGTHLGVVVP